MGRKTYRTLVEDTNKVSIWQLKSCINNDNLIKKTLSKGFTMLFQYENLGTDFAGERCEAIKVIYLFKNGMSETRSTLTTSRCYFGGSRYWFKCPYCSKRVGTLYEADGHFACRCCLNLTYYSNNVNRKYKLYLYQKETLRHRKAQALLSHRMFYSGKPTRFKKKIDRLMH